MSNLPFNSKISLITKSQIRYEGILTGVNTDDSTITLTNVKSFGTEDRETDNAIYSSGSVYEYMIYHASDILDIEVCEPVGSISDPLYLQQAYLYLKRYPPNAGQDLTLSGSSRGAEQQNNLQHTISLHHEDRNEGSYNIQVESEGNKQTLSIASNSIPRPALNNNTLAKTDPVVRNKKPSPSAQDQKIQTYELNSTTELSSKRGGYRSKPTYRVKGTDLPNNSETTILNISPDKEHNPANSSPESTPKTAQKKRQQKVFRPKQRNDSTDNPGEIGTSSDM
jgi:hypothetical protein